jgi:SPP1 gp7 family putative phage head morphogenesis protein
MATPGSEALFREILKQHRAEMTPAKREKTKHPKPVKQFYPLGIEKKYFREIRSWLQEFTKITNETLETNLDDWIESYELETAKIDSSFRTDSYSSEFKSFIFKSFIEELYDEQVKQFVTGAGEKRAFISTVGFEVSDFNQKQWQKQVKKLIGTTLFVAEPWEAEVIATWAETNFTLIKSLSDEYIKKTNLIVSEGVQTGLGSKEIKGQVKKLNKNITNTRANLIARDQVGKLNGRLTKRRQQEVGLDLYYWMTAADERVRKSHRGLDGTVNEWGDPSKYSTDGGKTWKSRTGGMTKQEPGQDVQCRCDGPAFFDDLIEDVDRELKAEQKRALELGPSGF